MSFPIMNTNSHFGKLSTTYFTAYLIEDDPRFLVLTRMFMTFQIRRSNLRAANLAWFCDIVCHAAIYTKVRVLTNVTNGAKIKILLFQSTSQATA